MKTAKSIPDLEQFRNHPLHSTLKELFAMYRSALSARGREPRVGPSGSSFFQS